MSTTFIQLHEAGFGPLLPIIPPKAKISSYSNALHDKPDMLGKIPGKRVSDGWVGLADWATLSPSPEDYEDWQESGAGIGLRCETVVAVDVDITHELLSRVARQEVYTWLGFGPCRVGNPPKRLFLFRLSEPGCWASKRTLSFLDWDGEKQLVELLGARQQFIVQGVHPKTGKPYEWDMDPAELGLEGLPEVTPEELDHFLTELADTLAMLDCDVHPVRTHHSASAPRNADYLDTEDLDLLRDVVAHIPNTEEEGYDDLATMAHAVRAAAGEDVEEGLAILQGWSERWPLGADPEETERIYRSVQGSSIGIQWLVDKAREHGYSSSQADFEDEVVDGGEEDVADGLPTVGPDGWQPDGKGIWDTWVYVNRLKRFIHLRNNSMLDKEQFDDVFVALGDNQKPSKFFIEHRRPQSFADDVDYRPGDWSRVKRDTKGGRLLMNMWRPGPVHSGEWDGLADDRKAVTMWYTLAEHLFPNEQERETLFDWMAYLVQHPGVKPNWHPLIGGHVHGTGKDSLFTPLVRGLGDNARTIRNSDLEGEWTWWAENVQLVTVSEITSFERKAVMNRLKSYMATPPETVEINKKGVPQYEIPNLFAIVMFTNNEDAVALERFDRRFYVLWTDAGVLPESFYEEYHRHVTYSDQGAAAVMRELMARDLSSFSVKGNAPSTSAKEEMRRAALGQVEGTLLAAIESGQGPFACDLVTNGEVELWLRHRVPRMPSPQKLAVMLRGAGCVSLGRARISTGEGRQRIWACRRIDTYVQLEGAAGVAAVRDRMIKQREKISGAEADFAEAG